MLRTPFHQFHLDHGGKMVDFAGWELPIMYRSIHEEHHQVRNAAGIFDVSHMGRFYFTGRHARRFLERVCTRRISDMAPGSCRYSLVCNESGGTKDDVILYRFDERWLMVCNAANRAKLLEHFEQVKGDLSFKLSDDTEKTAMVAIQGPKVMEQIGRFSRELPALKRYTFTVKNLLILKMICSRTGYTGEDGLEVILPANMVGMAMKLLMKEGEDGKQAIQPCGLGARDTLRMEAGMPLYGHELSEEIDPFTAGLDFAVSLDKDKDDQFGEPEPFIGQAALKEKAVEGLRQRLMGLRLDGKRTARPGMTVTSGDKAMVACGHVTSACTSPTLGYPIAMALLEAPLSNPGTKLLVDFGSAAVEAQVVPLPFYKRS